MLRGTHRVRVQVLLLAQPVQEGGLLLEEGLPRGEEHRAPDVQPDPLPVAPRARVDDRAVPEALRRLPAGLARAGRGGRRALSRLAVFVVVVVIVVVAVEVEARGGCHLGGEKKNRREARDGDEEEEASVRDRCCLGSFSPSPAEEAPPTIPRRLKDQ